MDLLEKLGRVVKPPGVSVRDQLRENLTRPHPRIREERNIQTHPVRVRGVCPTLIARGLFEIHPSALEQGAKAARRRQLDLDLRDILGRQERFQLRHLSVLDDLLHLRPRQHLAADQRLRDRASSPRLRLPGVLDPQHQGGAMLIPPFVFLILPLCAGLDVADIHLRLAELRLQLRQLQTGRLLAEVSLPKHARPQQVLAEILHEVGDFGLVLQLRKKRSDLRRTALHGGRHALCHHVASGNRWWWRWGRKKRSSRARHEGPHVKTNR